MLSCLFIAALWPQAGKGLTSWLSFVMLNSVFVTFSCGVLGQVWYLLISIPDLAPVLTLKTYIWMGRLDPTKMNLTH